MSDEPELPYSEAEVLRYVRAAVLVTDRSLYWNRVRRAAANRLVKKGLLERRELPLAPGYAVPTPEASEPAIYSHSANLERTALSQPNDEGEGK